jgi:uncharacterized protein with GYD domain
VSAPEPTLRRESELAFTAQGAPGDAVMAWYALPLGSLSFVRTQSLKALPENACREIIRSLG